MLRRSPSAKQGSAEVFRYQFVILVLTVIMDGFSSRCGLRVYYYFAYTHKKLLKLSFFDIISEGVNATMSNFFNIVLFSIDYINIIIVPVLFFVFILKHKMARRTL